jgi:hypothetical protein
MLARLTWLGAPLAVVVGLAARVRADVVDSCPHYWQQGYEGHGMTCETSWPMLGASALACVLPAFLIAGVLLLASRRPPTGRTRGD